MVRFYINFVLWGFYLKTITPGLKVNKRGSVFDPFQPKKSMYKNPAIVLLIDYHWPGSCLKITDQSQNNTEWVILSIVAGVYSI